VNLAIMNLLPLPVLDGGHILLGFIEWICGRPIHQKTLEVIQTTFAMLLIGAMLYVSFFDVGDLIMGRKSGPIAEKAAETMTFSPSAPSAANTPPARP